MDAKLKAGSALAIFLILAVSIGQCVDAKWDRARLAQERDDLAAKLAGANEALSTKPKVIVNHVKEYVPRDVIKLVEKKVLIPIAGATVETPTQTVRLPCPSVSTGQGGEADSGMDVGVALKGGLLLTMTKGGKPYWNGQLTTRLTGQGWERTLVHALDEHTMTVNVSKDITGAVSDHLAERRISLGLRPIKQWRMGWSAGPGLSYDPFSRQGAPVVAVVWGGQF